MLSIQPITTDQSILPLLQNWQSKPAELFDYLNIPLTLKMTFLLSYTCYYQLSINPRLLIRSGGGSAPGFL
jgi:hypothetical protein